MLRESKKSIINFRKIVKEIYNDNLSGYFVFRDGSKRKVQQNDIIYSDPFNIGEIMSDIYYDISCWGILYNFTPGCLFTTNVSSQIINFIAD